jgi:hypothetical protein
MAGFVAVATVTLFGAVLVALIFISPPEGNIQILNILFGSLVAKYGDIVNFFFSSSASDRSKNDTIGTQAQALATAATNATPPDAKAPVVLQPGEQKVVKAEDPANPSPGDPK